MINNVITYDIMQKFINNQYEFAITRDSILTSLNNRIDSINSTLIFFIIFIIFMIVIYIIKKRKNLITTIIVFFLVCLFTNGIYKLVCEKNNIKYSIKNNCWSIENDLVIDKFIKKHITPGNFDISYWLKLNQYGKMQISPFMYENLEKNDNVYVVCVQDKSEKKYPITGNVWPFKETLFIESLPLP